MLPSLVRRAADRQHVPPFDFRRNPYKAKHVWPPDFSKLSEKHQFRLERRYKRRAKLKWARPRLMVATKLVQWAGGIGVLTYGLLFMDWGDERAFKGIRDWYKDTRDSMFMRRPPRNTSQSNTSETT